MLRAKHSSNSLEFGSTLATFKNTGFCVYLSHRLDIDLEFRIWGTSVWALLLCLRVLWRFCSSAAFSGNWLASRSLQKFRSLARFTCSVFAASDPVCGAGRLPEVIGPLAEAVRASTLDPIDPEALDSKVGTMGT